MSDDVLEEANEAFKLCDEREADNRREALDDLRFARLAEQWPADIRRKREEEGRPCLTINRLPAFIRQVARDPALERRSDAPRSPGAPRRSFGGAGPPTRQRQAIGSSPIQCGDGAPIVPRDLLQPRRRGEWRLGRAGPTRWSI